MNRQQFRIAKVPSNNLALDNCVYMSTSDFAKMHLKQDDFIIVDDVLVHRVRSHGTVTDGNLAISNLQLNALHLDKKRAVGTTVTVESWHESKQNENNVASSATIVVDIYGNVKVTVEMDELEEYIIKHFTNEIFCLDQRWIVKWQPGSQARPVWLKLHIADLEIPARSSISGVTQSYTKTKTKTTTTTKTTANIRKLRNMYDSVRIAQISKNSIITLVAARNPLLNLKFPHNAQFSTPNWNPEEMGIGGLDAQFATIFRRAFASRLFPAKTVKELGVRHVKGMLLFGPPGTGKTLIARCIGGLLTDNEPKVVNGPEILNKMVGESEANIRRLFADAEADQKMNGDKASLHIIIFDEIDAICKQRGSTNTGTGVQDTIVNQLLSKIDGVNSLNNVLIIGMTNRKDLLDNALLRAGRLEVHVEIGLPNEQGRQQIFRIHTRSIRENGYLDNKISINSLAKRTKNYSGAEIESVVRSAVSFTMQQQVDVGNGNNQSIGKIDVRKLKNIKITQEYFDLALQEVKPEFGIKDDDLQSAYKRGIYLFNDNVKEIIKLGKLIVSKMRKSNILNRQAILLRGNLGVGKSALAAYVAQQANFPFIRIISADQFVGATDSTICTNIGKVFNDAYKSENSVVILDDLERIIRFTVGPRFSNSILQSLLTCIRRQPGDTSKKILIIATSDYDIIRTLSIDKVFDFVRDVPQVKTPKEFAMVLRKSGTERLCQPNVNAIINCWPKYGKVGISDLLTVLELATDDNEQITIDTFKAAWHGKFQNSSNDINSNGNELNDYVDVFDFDIDTDTSNINTK